MIDERNSQCTFARYQRINAYETKFYKDFNDVAGYGNELGFLD